MTQTQTKQRCVLGICGGVGPAAGVLLHQIILEHTASGGCDQGHFDVVHFSRSEDMTDRTEYLQHYATQQHQHTSDGISDGTSDGISDGISNSNDTTTQQRVENPARGMARTLGMMRAAVTYSSDADYPATDAIRLVTGVPCNTFHAAPIWDEFVQLTAPVPTTPVLTPVQLELQHVHMLEETVRYIAQCAPLCTRIGLFATTGTRDARVYHDLLEPRGYVVLEVARTLQPELHASIYDSTWGIKSTAPAVTPQVVANFERYAQLLVAAGADVIVMGCTEIPFAFAGRRAVAGALLIDPLVALARAMIRTADPTRLKPLAVELSSTSSTSSSTGIGTSSGTINGSCVAPCVTPLDKLSQPRAPTKFCTAAAVSSSSQCWSLQ